MRARVTAAAFLALLLGAPAARAQRVNKMPVRHVEAALVLDTGTLRVRLTLETGQALDYDVRDEGTITRVLKFIEISAESRMGLAAEIGTDGHTIRALHLVPEELRPRR
jgi:hypothetical protein